MQAAATAQDATAGHVSQSPKEARPLFSVCSCDSKVAISTSRLPSSACKKNSQSAQVSDPGWTSSNARRRSEATGSEAPTSGSSDARRPDADPGSSHAGQLHAATAGHVTPTAAIKSERVWSSDSRAAMVESRAASWGPSKSLHKPHERMGGKGGGDGAGDAAAAATKSSVAIHTKRCALARHAICQPMQADAHAFALVFVAPTTLDLCCMLSESGCSECETAASERLQSRKMFGLTFVGAPRALRMTSCHSFQTRQLGYSLHD